MLLSIIVPTYNRPNQLARTIRKLARQCVDHGVAIGIIDNASPIPVETIVSEQFEEYKSSIWVIRNPVNIGGDANICRCYESASSEWFWLLGDDDEPAEDAVASILSEIKLASVDCGYICFSTNKGRFQGLRELESGGGFWEFVGINKSLNNMSFISSGVYRSSAAKSCIINAYRAIHSCFSQLVVIREIHRRGYSIRLSEKFICEWQFPEPGHQLCSVNLLSGIADLLDVDGFGLRSKSELVKLFDSCHPRPFLKWVWKLTLNNQAEQSDYLMRLFRRVTSISKGRHTLACMIGVGISWLRSWMPRRYSR